MRAMKLSTGVAEHCSGIFLPRIFYFLFLRLVHLHKDGNGTGQSGVVKEGLDPERLSCARTPHAGRLRLLGVRISLGKGWVLG